MAFVIADRVRETSTSIGTGNFTLAGAITGYQSFDSALDTGDTTYYTIADQSGANWEVGIGTFTSPSTLARTTILSSSNTGSIVTFGAGTKDVFISLPASKTNTVEAGNLVFASTAQRITGDMSNATHANRLSFQSSVTNGSTSPFFIPNGTGTSASVVVANASDPTNSSFGQIVANGSTDIRINSSILGTGTYLPMTFYTGGSERVRVDTSGNVGIGTSSPVSKLNVSGAVTSSDGTAGGGAFALGTSANGVLSATSTTLLTLNGAGYTNVSINGNVGIGTTSPGYLFDTYNSSTGTDYIAGRFYSVAAASGESRTWLKVEKSSTYGGAIGGYLSQGVGSGLLFGTQNGSATPTERMRIDNSGNVGIGTTTTNPIAAGRNLAINSASGTAAWSLSCAGTLGMFAYSDGTSGAISVYPAGALQFLTNNTERMRINSSGNVGIGTSSPKNTLDVSGSITLDQNYQTYLVNSYYDGAWKYIGNGFAWGIGNNFGGSTNGTTIAVASVNAGGAGAALTWNPVVNIDSSGNVGINTSSPGSTLDVAGWTQVTTSAATGAGLRVRTPLGSGSPAIIQFTNYPVTAQWGYINSPAANVLAFGGNTEYARFDSSGNLLVGTSATSNTQGLYLGKGAAAGGGIVVVMKTTSGATNSLLNYYGTTYVGGVNYDNTSTSFPTSSDVRLKKDISDAPSASAKIENIRIVSHGWKHDDALVDYGVIAQELYDVFPRAVDKGDDGEEIEKTWSVDYSKLVPLLIKAHQELSAKVAALEAKA